MRNLSQPAAPRHPGFTHLLRALLAGLAAVLILAGAARPQPASTPQAEGAAPTTPQPAPVPAYRQARNVAIITIQGEIDGGGRFRESVMVASVRRRIAAAVKGGADAIVFEIDSPGGEVDAALRLAELIKDCPIKNTVAWIHPRALSGGAIVALSCREIIITDGSNFGDAMPVRIRQGPDGAYSLQRVDPEMLKKVLPVLISSVVDSARRHNETFGAYRRDEYLTQALVANDVPLWWVRNPSTGIEMAIDRREFELLFPDTDPNLPVRLAGIKSLQNTPPEPAPPVPTPPQPSHLEQGADRTPTAELPGAPAGSEKLATVRDEALRQQAAGSPILTRPTSRPVLTAADAGQWELVDRVTDGTAPATLSALDLAHYNFASNTTRGADGRSAINPINNDDDLKAYFGAQNIRRFDKNWSEGFVVLLTHPLVRGVFIAVFIVCLFIEMSHPGASLPGLIAVLALIMALAPSMIAGLASWWEVAAILGGVALLAIEVCVLPGFGVAGILGLILLFAGLLGTFIPAGNGIFPTGKHEQSQLLWGLASLLAATLTSGIAIYFIAKHLGSVPLLNRFVLRDAGTDEESAEWAATNLAEPDAPAKVGDTATAVTDLRPGGKIDVLGQVVDATAESGWIERGTRVKVVSVSGFRIGVEPA